MENFSRVVVDNTGWDNTEIFEGKINTNTKLMNFNAFSDFNTPFFNIFSQKRQNKLLLPNEFEKMFRISQVKCFIIFQDLNSPGRFKNR